MASANFRLRAGKGEKPVVSRESWWRRVGRRLSSGGPLVGRGVLNRLGPTWEREKRGEGGRDCLMSEIQSGKRARRWCRYDGELSGRVFNQGPRSTGVLPALSSRVFFASKCVSASSRIGDFVAGRELLERRFLGGRASEKRRGTRGGQ